MLPPRCNENKGRTILVDYRETTVIQSFESKARDYLFRLHLQAMGSEAWIEKDGGGGKMEDGAFFEGHRITAAYADDNFDGPSGRLV